MKRYLFFFLFLCFAVELFAQAEAVSPLNGNFELQQKRKQYRSYPDIFIYEIDTINLPFMDDFSRDFFKSYNAQQGDPNVTTQLYYHLYDASGTVALNDTVKYMNSVTYYIEYDTINGDTVQINTPLDSIQITINDLTAYPIVGTLEWVYPRYYIIDTLWLPSSPDTIWIPNPNVVQDSVYVNFVSSVGDISLWQDRFVYRNNRYPIGPPTIGVATFDGLDENGYPYDFINTTLTGYCDYLTSKPINLDLKPGNIPYTAADSVYLSFFYQPTGRGNQPEAGDSLILEFWSPSVATWYQQWASPGALSDETFKQVLIPITDNLFFEDGFMFRFKNKGNLSGSLDHWHIDYVYLNSIRNIHDTIRPDVAFVYDVVSILKDYSRMPWTHYQWNPAGYMADTLSVYQRNNDDVAKIVVAQQMEISYQGTPQGTITSPNIPSVSSYSNFSSLYDIGASAFVFDTSLADECKVLFDVAVSFNPGSNFQPNDTLYFQQYFGDEYAYDDGSAEAAYGPQAANAKLAYKFSIPNQDTLRSVRIHFEPSVNNVSGHPFFLTVWDGTGPGTTPGNVLSANTTFHFPTYEDSLNGFTEYALDVPVAISGTFFVGWRQLDADKLNIGFDYNTNAQNKIMYNVSGSWVQTGFQGALMMRPVFDRCIGDVTSVTELNKQEIDLSIWPNPSQSAVNIEANVFNAQLSIYDLSGRIIRTEVFNGRTTFDVSEFSNGFYIVEIVTQDGIRGSKKIVVQH